MLTLGMMSTCHECVTLTDGCCVFSLVSGWKVILLPSEITRIAAVAQKTPLEFVDTSPLIPSQLQTYISDGEDSIWAQFFSLWRNPSGVRYPCPFLKRSGCSLPYESKPFICRVYPLVFNITTGSLYCPGEMPCLVGRTRPTLEEIVNYFGDNIHSLNDGFMVFRKEFLSSLNQLERLERQLVSTSKKNPKLSFSLNI
jgi:Fe-S-cluster containining protein